MPEERLKLVRPWRERLRRGAAPLLEDLPGAAGLTLGCAGIYRLWGGGWTLVAAGAVCLAYYVWCEWCRMKFPPRRRSEQETD